ncbi:MAG: CDP-diacylglycerol--glycerol-3-phosphate 3-phosphatidyltransferase, partial [Peptostreptococcaceae bacterium]|nr:CDP-diacylglycerol--glycerol-3-phosphate 3-phosphatidyltransferase [Peptostreptococcaceae bacterium]
MNTPNKLTTLRVILVPFFILAFYIELKANKNALIIATII